MSKCLSGPGQAQGLRIRAYSGSFRAAFTVSQSR
jgi:hypothetical protein